MNRFFYYLMLINMITNIVSSNSKVLLQYSDKGAISSMILAVGAGLIITSVVAHFFNKFPGEGLPELLEKYTPIWFSKIVLSFLLLNFYLAGMLTLIAYTFILKGFLAPEMSIYVIVLAFVLFVSFGILMKTGSVLYTIEIILILFGPVFLFILAKAYTSHSFEWDSVRVAMMHINHLPEMSSFTTATFSLIGSVNLVIFNRIFTKQQTFTFKSLLTVGALSIAVLFTMYFVPIGFAGFDHVKDLVYPWISATDSMRMKFGLVERVTFLFILLFLGIALLSLTLHWHVAYHLLISIFPKKKSKRKSMTSYCAIFLFWVISFTVTIKLSEYQFYKFAITFDNFLPLFFAMLLLTFFVVNRGAKSR